MGDLISKSQGPGVCDKDTSSLEVKLGSSLSVAGEEAQRSLQGVQQDGILLPSKFLPLLHYKSRHIQIADLLSQLKGMNVLRRMRRGENATVPLGRAASFYLAFPIS